MSVIKREKPIVLTGDDAKTFLTRKKANEVIAQQLSRDSKEKQKKKH